jgi:hypothetical protein
MAPVAAEIMARRPPAKAMMMAIENEAYSPTLGSTPAMMENEMASGISASATTMPARMSARGLENHSDRIERAGVAAGAYDIDIGRLHGRSREGREPVKVACHVPDEALNLSNRCRVTRLPRCGTRRKSQAVPTKGAPGTGTPRCWAR